MPGRCILIIRQPRLQSLDLLSHLAQKGLGVSQLAIGIIKACLYGLVEGEIGNESLGSLGVDAAQSELLLLVQFRGEGQKSALLESEHASKEFACSQRVPDLVLHQM